MTISAPSESSKKSGCLASHRRAIGSSGSYVSRQVSSVLESSVLSLRQWLPVISLRSTWGDRHAMPEPGLLPVWRSPCSVCLRPLLLSWVYRSFEDMSTNQQERGDFAVPWQPFILPARWAGFERAFKHKTRGTQRVEIGAEHAVMVCNPATDSVRVR